MLVGAWQRGNEFAHRLDRVVGSYNEVSTINRSGKPGPAPTACALQGAWSETPTYRCRYTVKPRLALEVVRLAIVRDCRSTRYDGSLASSRLATVLALQIATGPAAHSA